MDGPAGGAPRGAPGPHQRAASGATGEPELVLVHGGAQNAHTWDTVALALGRPLVALDLPGPRPLRLARRPRLPPGLQRGRRRRRHRGPRAARRAAVVGMSLGGLTASLSPASRPDLVRRLVPRRRHARRRTSEKAAPITAFVAGPQTFERSTRSSTAPCSSTPPARSRRCAAAILHNAEEQRRRQLEVALRPASRIEATEARRLRVRRLCGTSSGAAPVPLLLLRGALSPVVDDDDVAEVLRRQPDAEVVVVEDAGHSIQGDRPVELRPPARRLRPAPLIAHGGRAETSQPGTDGLGRLPSGDGPGPRRAVRRARSERTDGAARPGPVRGAKSGAADP